MTGNATGYDIRTLELGELLLPLPHGAGLLRDPVFAWLVSDAKNAVLVDSGMPDVETVRKRLNVDSAGGGNDRLRSELKRAGLEPGDVGTVLLTHLHFDHAWNLDLFPDARVVVQRDELFHAVDPSPTQRIYYFRETTLELLKRRRPRQFQLVDGDFELLPGIRVLKSPGHTPGMQVPIVRTSRGCVGLVSDLGDHYRYWYPADPAANEQPLRFMAGSFLPGPIRTESEAVYVESMRRVIEHADIVVPAHDGRIPRRMPDEWFAVPPFPSPS